MKCPTLLVLAVFLRFQGNLPLTRSQRTHARQGLGRELPIVKIPNQGSISGKEVPLGGNQRVIQYLGIPYAQPPIKNLRFAIPVTDPLPSWKGVRNATQFGASCQQILNRFKLHETLYRNLLPPDQPNPEVSEDCLFLNIFVPDGNRPDDGWPVMVWFHGGDFNTGTPAIWDASVFVNKQKVLVVTVAYRLNIFGFFTTMDAEAPGNYGMFDQLAALDWIQKNIQLFNGSPSNIVIYGHSSGAISVGLHMVSPLSRGKFSKAIAMSGDAISSVRSARAETEVVNMIAERFGCYRSPTTALMECLRRVDVNILTRESSDIETWGPIVDAETTNVTEPFLSMHPREALELENFNPVPLLAGYTSKEQALSYMEAIGKESQDGGLSVNKFETIITDEFVSAIQTPDDNSTCELKSKIVVDAVLFFYKPHPPTKDQGVIRDRFLDLQTERNFAAGLTFLAGKVSKSKPAFVYRFDYRPGAQSVTKDLPEWAGVPHMFELPFIWGLPHAIGTTIQWNFSDKKMSVAMMTMFGNFARVGNPSLSNVKWEPFTEDNPGILIIDRNIDMNDEKAVDFKALAFWNEYYPKIVEEATNNCCNVTSASPAANGISHGVHLASFTVAMILWYSRIY